MNEDARKLIEEMYLVLHGRKVLIMEPKKFSYKISVKNIALDRQEEDQYYYKRIGLLVNSFLFNTKLDDFIDELMDELELETIYFVTGCYDCLKWYYKLSKQMIERYNIQIITYGEYMKMLEGMIEDDKQLLEELKEVYYKITEETQEGE